MTIKMKIGIGTIIIVILASFMFYPQKEIKQEEVWNKEDTLNFEGESSEKPKEIKQEEVWNKEDTLNFED